MAAVDRPLFIAQDKLTQWEGEGKVTVNGSILTLIAEGRSYALVDAVRFLTVIGDEADPHGLIGRVRNRDQLKALHAEVMSGTVILEDTGYQVQEGYVGTPLAPPPSTSVRPTPVPPPRQPPPVAARAPVAAPVAAPAPPPPPPPAPAAPAAGSSPSIADALGESAAKSAPSDAELLANFLLDNLAI